MPSDRNASAIRVVSRLRSGFRSTETPSARAASSSARLVNDFEPGTETVAPTGPAALGAGHSSAMTR